MRTKGVLLLGFIVCWIAVCNAGDGYLYDYGLEDSLSEELAEDKLFRAYGILRDDEKITEVECPNGNECSDRQKCVEKEEGKKICECIDGLSGKDCKTMDWCEDDEKFGKCKAPIGKCDYDSGKKNVVCICDSGKQWDDEEKTCKEVKCTNGDDCGDREICFGEEESEKICKCADGLSGIGCENKDWCEVSGKFEKCTDPIGKCDYDSGKKNVVCICDSGKQWDDGEKTCKDFKCPKGDECGKREKCVGEKEAERICKCADGLSGIGCEKLDWCEDPNKFEKCKTPNGNCEYNDGKKAVVCNCGPEKQWDPTESKCKKTCDKDEQCEESQKCVPKGDLKFCECADGLSGDDCSKKDWCEGSGKFKNCKGDNGTCEYSKDKRSVDCLCSEGKKLHPEDNICKETCDKDEQCEETQKCVAKGDLKFCECADGLSGNDCSKKDWCEGSGKFKNCKGDDGTCEYSKDKRSVVCLCSDGKKLHPKDNICKVVECPIGNECGEREKCAEEGDKKICKCADGLSGIGCENSDWCKDPEKFEKCKDTNGKCEYDKVKKSVVCTCGSLKEWKYDEKICKDTCSKDEDCADREKCGENDGWKSCQCADGLSGSDCSKNDWCEGDGKFKNCKGANGTCDYIKDKRSLDCTCASGKKLHPTENRCRETCKDNSGCDNGGNCDGKEGEDKFCTCKLGLIGDRCQTVFDCTSGKYKGCEESGGTCKYDGNKAVCECTGNKKLHEKDNVCKVTCSKDEDCAERQKCVENDGWKSCQCADGLSGNDCSTQDWCVGNGKFKSCKGANGTCEYIKDKRSLDCTCAPGKKLHPTENRCRETCAEDSDCQNGGKCEEKGGNKFCTCSLGVIGDKCQIVYDCSLGKYKNCNTSGGNCTYDGSKAVCECSDKKKLHDKENICKVCDCGPKGTCKFEDGKPKCDCNSGSAVKDGKCRETCDEDCDNAGECKEFGESKFCECKKGLSGDKCEIVDECQKTLKDCKDERGTCEYDTTGNKAVCTCHHEGKEFNPDLKYCQETCTADNECNGGKCSGTEEKKFCKCLEGKLKGDKCDIVIDCESGKYSNCEGTGGTCYFKDGKSRCDCPEEKKLDESSTKHICRKKCASNEECNNGAKCEKELCKCPSGTEGDDCSKVTACDTLKCEDKKAVCTYNSSLSENTFCVCEDNNYIFVKNDKKCVEKCKPKEFCQHGGTCNSETNLCVCKPNTKGEKCQDIIGCDKLKCPDKISECVYDLKNTKAICKCNEPNHYFENGQCKAEWCRQGCNTAVSTCKYENGVGTCICKASGTYYDYTAKTCKKFDSCFNKTCDGDLICKAGKCQCPENYKQNDTRCEKMDLCKTKCFIGAKCEEGISDGYVKCSCNVESKFYLSRTKKCEDGKCFITDGRKDCKKPCPAGMSFKDGNCKHDKDENNCNEDCGFLGWCKKTGEKTDCVCLTEYAEKDSKTKKCVLKASAVCPKERDGDNKCKCTDKYKLSNNGITCELKSCSDEDVQKECKSIGATCVDSWKNGAGYDCRCPLGYTKVEKKGCLDPCSLDNMKDTCSSNGQVCYIGDKTNVGDCRCPPTFTYNEAKKSCDLGGDNTFMIHKLPVLRKKYESIENNINEVKLNIDVKKSMDQAFRNLEFVHVFSFKADKDVLLCDVWLQFKSNLDPAFNATLEVRRWKSHTVKGDNEYLLPPELLLSSTDIDAASEEELTLCSPSVQQSICGSGSSCMDNKCTCGEGFREIESTIKASSNKRIVRCEDIDECTEGKHNCKENSKCVNTLGSYFCKCNSGFKKEKGDADAMDKEACVDLCHGNPCGKGTCQLTKENTIDCACQVGYKGSFCNKEDVNLAKAGKATKVVGAVLGTLLAIVIILIIVYIVKQRKNSYSEDFTPAPRVDNAEMVERRPMRGVTNRGYQ